MIGWAMREASAAGAEYVRCADFVGPVAGYDFRDGGDTDAPDGPGYYRRPDAPPPDEWEYSRIVLQRASAAGAAFVACPEDIMALPGYEHRSGADGVGYYRLDTPPGPDQPQAGAESFDDFMSTMKELGAV